MKKEFVPYELAVKLKALGFDEPCFGYYSKGVLSIEIIKSGKIFTNEDSIYFDKDSSCLAPTFSQAFRWFRERYALCIVIKPIDHKKLEFGYNLTKNGLIMGAYTTYEKAELACLEKLIELTFKSE